MHLTLYRKFRPDSFDKIVRQEHVVTILKNQIEKKSVGHAYLFTGPRGTGKTSVARIFSRAINCLSPVNGSPCGKCEICKGKNGLDIIEIDAASNNGVNEMRDLREKVQYPPVAGEYKVYIVDEVHMLTDSAFNALLKTLEEPPKHAVFILATTEPQKVPATILSRCMRLDFKLIPTEDLEAHLRGILTELNVPFEEEAISAIARAGAGSDRDMLSIAEMCLAYADTLTYDGVNAVLGSADFTEIMALTEAILNFEQADALARTEKVLSSGKAVGVLCRDLLTALNRVAIAKACGASAAKMLALPDALFAALAKAAERAEGHAVLRATEVLAEAETALRYATSPRIVLETAILKASMPAADYNLDALLARVSSLEREIETLKSGAFVAAKPGKTEKPEKPEKTEMPEQTRTQRNQATEEALEPAYWAEEPPPEEEFVPFERGPAPKREKREPDGETRREQPQAAQAPAGEAHGEQPAIGARPVSAQIAFGKFLRLLRKMPTGGVLRTLCDDLEASYEGSLLVLVTESANVAASLRRENHRSVMREVFAQVGIREFEVRLRGESKGETGGIDALKRDFSDYPIEIK